MQKVIDDAVDRMRSKLKAAKIEEAAEAVVSADNSIDVKTLEDLQKFVA
jgi:hypothetical protein